MRIVKHPFPGGNFCPRKCEVSILVVAHTRGGPAPGVISGQPAFHHYPDIAVQLVVLYLLNKGYGPFRADQYFPLNTFGREVR